MTIKTKFSLEDRVFVIQKFGNNEFVSCQCCEGTGGIVTEKGKFTCNECHGSGGKYEWVGDKWKIAYKNTKIGKVYIEMYYEKYYEENPNYRNNGIKYMVTATGIGSGSIWYERDVFKTERQAQLECDRRNKEENIKIETK
jgi:hypothetical protein